MPLKFLRKWLSQVVNTAGGRRPARLPSRRQRLPMWLEQLEARLAPATAITVLPGPSGSGSQDPAFLASNGQLLFAAPNVGGNTLSTGALAAVTATSDIVVQATDHISFSDLGGTLTLQTGPGNSATF